MDASAAHSPDRPPETSSRAPASGQGLEAVAFTTGHVPNSAVLDRYLRAVDCWSDEDNAVVDIGL